MSLILTRRVGETIRISGNIDITVLGIKGAQVRIAVDAPHEITVDRLEIAEAKQRDAESKIA